jgi:hypothetical protein
VDAGHDSAPGAGGSRDDVGLSEAVAFPIPPGMGRTVWHHPWLSLTHIHAF